MKRTAVALALIMQLLFTTIAGTYLMRTVTAKTITVPSDYSTIQSAIDAANVGDIVFVKSGYYPETIVIYKRISLIGEDRNSTIIDAYQLAEHVITITGRITNVTVANFTLGNNKVILPHSSGGTPVGGDGIRVEYTNYNTIINNTIINVPRSGITVLSYLYTEIVGNTFINCSREGTTFHGSNSLIANNTFVNVPWLVTDYGENNIIEENSKINLAKIPSPFQPEFPSWIILPMLIVMVICISFLIYFKKRKH